MKTYTTLHLRRFPVTLQNERGAVEMDYITLDREMLRAAQMVGQSSKEVISRLYARQGYKVLDIGAARKVSAAVELDGLAGDAD